MRPDFRKALEQLLNIYSKENGSNTPDFILAEYMNDCLTAFDRTVIARAKWYGRGLEAPGGATVDPSTTDAQEGEQ